MRSRLGRKTGLTKTTREARTHIERQAQKHIFTKATKLFEVQSPYLLLSTLKEYGTCWVSALEQ